MDQPDGSMLFSGQVVYACVAVGISLAAVTLGYLYTKSATRSNVNKSSERKEEEKDARPASQTTTQDSTQKSPVTDGAWPLEEGEGDSTKTKSERDPVEYCSHLQSEVKRTKQKVAIDKIEEKMTPEQKEEERKIQSDQLAAIFTLMQSQQEKFGVDSMEEIRSQMKLYV